MDAASREDVPRVSVDNLYDWERIKQSYADAAYAQLDARTKGRSKEDRARLRAAMEKVRFLVYKLKRGVGVGSEG